MVQQFPQLETLDYAGRCIQAKQVGGDYYDFLQVQQGRAALSLPISRAKGCQALL
jgi:serine phosphatase RsbU (regulator of sigma subunit)